MHCRLFLLLLFLSRANAQEQDKLVIHFFGASTCGECQEIKHEILIPLAREHADSLQVQFHEIDNPEGFKLMTEMEDGFGLSSSAPQVLFLPDTFLIGAEAITAHARSLIKERLRRHVKSGPAVVSSGSHDVREAIEKHRVDFTFWGITAAGVVDGVNPCAIATMIFLISFLATQKRKRSEVLLIGISFTSAVFLTYLLLGLGAFKILTALDQYRYLSFAIKWIAVALAGVLSLLSFVDAFSYKSTGRADSIRLQLPKSVKLRIHRVISGNLRGSQLILGAIVTGFLVTLLEAVCTGQVYLPTIILMTRVEGLRLTGWLYLVFYNVLFVLPLLAVMVLAFYGLEWNKLAETTQRHMVLLKILLGVVLGGLAVFLAIAG